MNISATTTVSSLTPTSATSGVTGAVGSQPSAPDPAAAGDRAHFSTFGELMSKLQELQSADPDKATQVLSSIASALGDKASADDTPGHLQDLADRFAQAAQTGDLSVLRPHAGHHHHPQVDGQPPATSDVPGANPGRSASYLRGAHDRMDEVESIISNALSGAQ